MERTLFGLFMLMAVSVSSLATVRTLCNMPYSPGQYTTFSAAHDASSDGDTIYVHGSSLSYGDISIYRALVIIGTGHHPDKQMPLVSRFGNINVNTSNVQLIGLRLNTLFSSYSNGVIKKCRVENNFIYGYTFEFYGGDNWLIEGNVIENIIGYGCFRFGMTSAHNTVIQNNIISSSAVGGVLIGVNNNSSQLTYFLNNVVIGTVADNYSFQNISYVQIDNNIFYGSSPGSLINNCTMNNNISFLCSDPSFYSPGINNLVAYDPKFVSVPLVVTTFSYDHDYHLAADSPGLLNGTDGTDRGVYGGLGYKFTMTGEPSIAEITAFTITSPTVIAPGGSLTISVTSKRVH
jgi:hypothetical protein